MEKHNQEIKEQTEKLEQFENEIKKEDDEILRF